jgi:hypothetical protein
LARERRTSAAIDDPSPDEDGETLEVELDEARAGAVPEMFRKMMALGLSGFFSTEAALRGALGDTVPREWVEFLNDQSERTREDFSKRLAEEFARVLEKVDLVELADQLLEDRTIEVKAEFKLRPRESGPADKRSRKDS